MENSYLLIFALLLGCLAFTIPVFMALFLTGFLPGVDTMHFGLIMTINLGIGYCTPPLGVSLYISGATVDRDLVYVTKAVLPFLLFRFLFCLF